MMGSSNNFSPSDWEKFTYNIQQINDKYQQIFLHIFHNSSTFLQNAFFNADFSQQAWGDFHSKSLMNPEKMISLWMNYINRFQSLINNIGQRTQDKDVSPLYQESNKDKRFQDPTWNENILFDFLKQFYLMTSELWNNYIDEIGKETPYHAYLKFYLKQLIDAFCPSNFILTNPQILKETIVTNGNNIIQGLNNLLHDLQASPGFLNISLTDKSSFNLGENIATTKGKVVFQNKLMQLICYKPKEQIYSTPILIVPAWINKYYILDLSEDNSFVRWLVENNFQVYIISWVNPDISHKNIVFDDYVTEGIVTACNFIKSAGFDNISAVGYCLGGTLLAITLAYFKANKINIISRATFFTTLLDFQDPGEISIFINEPTINAIEHDMNKKGYFDGRYLSGTFSLLRDNELIWSYFVNNYLLGKTPPPFDILYWNSDSTNLPPEMHSFYLRNMYLKNSLKVPDALTIAGAKINLSNIDIPTFFLSANNDHIAPWGSVYNSMKLLGSQDKTFCLSKAGHVVGVVNPPNKPKYSYWTNNDISGTNQQWFKSAKVQEGSWWPYWLEWHKKYVSNLVATKGSYEKMKEIEPAPGSYVKVKLSH